MYYAHRTSSSDKSQWHLLSDHLKAVACLAAKFADYFGAGPWAEIAGILHDAGKFSEEFQRRLAGAKNEVDHSTAGARYITEVWGDKTRLSRILAYVIAGHHSGLADFGSISSAEDRALARRLVKEVKSYKEALQTHIPDAAKAMPTFPIKPGFHSGLQLSLFIRMLFSCLIDADSLDTEFYAKRAQADLRGNHQPMEVLWDRYNRHMRKKFHTVTTEVELARAELLAESLHAALGEQGLYSLNLPTGSGKTLISLGFALRHAIRHGLRRIIFVIPYTSIIEQNANVFREAIGSENVLEHHSNVQLNADEDIEYTDESLKLQKKLSLATENWDFPVIVTTNVQFFESLFSNKRSQCRKLHNLAKSVIVLDEAQMMNGEFYKPSLYTAEELARNYGATIVFSTATQPLVDKLFPQSIELKKISRDVKQRFPQFQRVRIEQLGIVNFNSLTERLLKHQQALCIVNTRKAARKMYKKVSDILGKDSVFHLSARMCPAHRTGKLEFIRKLLEQKKPCILISTQLVECGVDVDFPVVYRELAGLDSIVQAAGRCNREGTEDTSTTFVFEFQDTWRSGWFAMTAAAARKILQRYRDNSLSDEAINDYFRELYFYQTGGGAQSDKTDRYHILDQLGERAVELAFPFETVSQQFKLIQSDTSAVIVNFDKISSSYLEALKNAEHTHDILRKLQPYVVQLYSQEFDAFRGAKEITEIRDNVFVLENPSLWYDDNIGIKPFSEDYAGQDD
ncbi:hypothetical protein B1A99_14205 [Cohnella sp. CIP 111063]|uniref:CRISPR-associated helicase/endonuclease Cas3 n=1 Tax=unclassified Cohnella TaxID=2636738 RepID=UPI000B8C59CE|nr:MULTISPECIES: CRISPR-associated helicase/endonuclease Cas3 [unclassified Cohnella]OXS58359.1 hypothetical protein B1A99_14205 [Cohnella sp. CIP 111063]PRX71643.1 CRISPR-associated Cas3 family helicase [Cohnella sp. SGD-V74]